MGTHGESHSRANVDVEDETIERVHGAWCMVHDLVWKTRWKQIKL